MANHGPSGIVGGKASKRGRSVTFAIVEPVPLNPDADIRRLVHIDPITGEVTTLKNLEVSGKYEAVRGTWSIKAPDRATSMAGRNHRYAGAQAVRESHGNAEVSWKALVKGTDPDDCLRNLELLVAAFEPLWREDTFIEWVPVGAAQATYYEVRAPARWQHNYEWAQWYGAMSLTVDVSVPVAPLAQGAAFDIDLDTFTAPTVIELDTTVAGTAPALADITVYKPGIEVAAIGGPAFGMFAWWNRLPTPATNVHQVFGLVDANVIAPATSLTTFTTDSETGTQGGSMISATMSGAGSGAATYALSTEGLDGPRVDVEIWARVYLDSAAVDPRLQVRAYNDHFGAYLYTREWGAIGRPLKTPVNDGFVLSRIGIISLPVGTRLNPDWKLDVTLSWQAGSSGLAGLDYLWLMPADQSCRTPTEEPDDDSYPRFMHPTSGAAGKTVTSDLRGFRGDPDEGNRGAGPGLGGAPIELPPGDVDLAVLFSIAPPDAPPVDLTPETEALMHPGITGSVRVTPRYYVINGGN